MSIHFLPNTISPLIQAPMAGAQGSAMAIAVCQGGGIGSLPAALLSPQQLADEIQIIQASTRSPFNVNFFAHTMPNISEAQTQRWQQCLKPYFSRFGVDPKTIQAGILRLPFGEEQLAVVQQYRPPLVSFHFGLPEPQLLRAVKDTGARVLSSATTITEAIYLAERGVDAIIAQGCEAGGHRGTFLNSAAAYQTGTLALLPQIVDAVSVPVIASGGIADDRGIQAALTLGAAAVQIGTAYLLCDESTISPLHRQAIEQAAQAPHTVQTAITNVFSGKPARGLVNALMRDLGLMNTDAAPFPYAAAEVNAIRAKAEAAGSTAFTPLWCGQNPSGCVRASAQTLTEQLIQAFD